MAQGHFLREKKGRFRGLVGKKKPKIVNFESKKNSISFCVARPSVADAVFEHPLVGREDLNGLPFLLDRVSMEIRD